MSRYKLIDNQNNQRNPYDGNNSGDNNDSRNNQNNNNNRGDEPRRPNAMIFLVITIVGLLLISYFLRLSSSSSSKEITYNEFIEMVQNDEIESVRIDTDQIVIMPKKVEGQQTSTGLFGSGGFHYFTGLIEDKETITKRLLAKGIEVKGKVEDGSSILISFLLTYVLPVILMWVVLSFLFRKISKSGGMGFGVGKSNAKVYGEKDTGVTFKDVAGEEEAKESLVEIVDFLHNPDKYSKIGAKLPKGALLVGPPGTGKTLLAKAVAGEAGVPFFSLAGSDFIELYVGVGASRVRDLFKEAEKNAPCIIFIDEIDAIGRSRDSKYGGGNEEREQTLNQLLSEMDGFDGKKGIIILAATNRPEILDKALLRPGRFDRRVIVEEPDLKGRIDILKVHAQNVLMDESVNFEEVALATVGAVGADLANMINEAAILAVKGGRQYVCQKDLLDAVELVLMGKEKKDKLMNKKEREIVSYHEVGHALISALQKNSEPVQKITIIPRTSGALGYVMSYPEEEKFMQTEAELRAELVSLLGGRAAEDIVFDTVTTGAANDIEKATKIARAMVTRFGMSKKFGLMGLETVESQYLDHRAVMNCSDETAADIDDEVMKILKDSYKEAKKLLKENRDILDKIAAYLIKKETITGHEFMEIFCKEKGIPMPKKDKGEESLAKLHKEQMEKGAQAYSEQQNYSRQNQGGGASGGNGKLPWQSGKGGSRKNSQSQPMNGNLWNNGQSQQGNGNPWNNGQNQSGNGNPWNNGQYQPMNENPWNNGQGQPGNGNPWNNGQNQQGNGNPWNNGQNQPMNGNPWNNGQGQPMNGNPWNNGQNQPGNGNPWDNGQNGRGNSQNQQGGNGPWGNGQNQPENGASRRDSSQNPSDTGRDNRNADNKQGITVRLSSKDNAPAPWDMQQPEQTMQQDQPEPMQPEAASGNGLADEGPSELQISEKRLDLKEVEQAPFNSGGLENGQEGSVNENAVKKTKKSKDEDYANQLKNRIYRDGSDEE